MCVRTSTMSCHSSIKSQSINFFIILVLHQQKSEVCPCICTHADVRSVVAKHIYVTSKCKEIPFWIIIYIVFFLPFFVFFRETSVHQGKLVNGVFYGVLSLPRNASLDVFRIQVALQEEVEAAIWEQECVLEDPVWKGKGQMTSDRGWTIRG